MNISGFCLSYNLQVLGNECVGISNIPDLVWVTSSGEWVCWHI